MTSTRRGRVAYEPGAGRYIKAKIAEFDDHPLAWSIWGVLLPDNWPTAGQPLLLYWLRGQ